MNRAAQALGRLAKGVPKTLTDEQRKFRAEQLAAARLKRHKKPKRKAGNIIYTDHPTPSEPPQTPAPSSK